jgi:hypothetical protein
MSLAIQTAPKFPCSTPSRTCARMEDEPASGACDLSEALVTTSAKNMGACKISNSTSPHRFVNPVSMSHARTHAYAHMRWQLCDRCLQITIRLRSTYFHHSVQVTYCTCPTLRNNSAALCRFRGKLPSLASPVEFGTTVIDASLALIVSSSFAPSCRSCSFGSSSFGGADIFVAQFVRCPTFYFITIVHSEKFKMY